MSILSLLALLRTAIAWSLQHEICICMEMHLFLCCWFDNLLPVSYKTMAWLSVRQMQLHHQAIKPWCQCFFLLRKVTSTNSFEDWSWGRGTNLRSKVRCTTTRRWSGWTNHSFQNLYLPLISTSAKRPGGCWLARYWHWHLSAKVFFWSAKVSQSQNILTEGHRSGVTWVQA